ncbi:MAG TPA: hypothetical protein VGX25_25240 [Actinophytocola sp.]|uniref:hypothetical protein n=1 Tax=Actinophytocola sp. TaxID=1872138 RepID=UPI002DDCEF1B|nr:hypothetical protein [Actinophytocola sp.]HEV2782710.1 hypothetical protein [Actinophytocola sp.]
MLLKVERVLVPTLALVVVLAGCSDGSGGGANSACATPSPAPPAETALMPAGLSFDKIGTVTHVVSTAGHITVQAITTKPLDEVTVLIQDAVTAAGYRPAGMDNEGFEAEVFFTSGSTAAGQALVRRADCEGQWTIDLVLIDPATLPSSTAPGPTTSPVPR